MSEQLYRYMGHTAIEPKYQQRAFGLELEVECVAGYNVSKIKHLHDVVIDDSLRNNGKEFISVACSYANALEFHHQVMHGPNVGWTDKANRCNERGSIHVHVNCLHLTTDQIFNALRLYCMLEPGFFNYIEPHRKNNIYCVPLHSTTLPYHLYSKNLEYVAEKWHKYTALNAKPLFKLGTLEFRHLQATDNTMVFNGWLDILNRFFDAAEVMEDEIPTFPTLLNLYQKVFEQEPTTETLEALKLCHQEAVVSHYEVTAKTLTDRIKASKAALCVD